MVNTTNANYRSLIYYDPLPTSLFIIKVNSGSNSQFTIPTTGGGYSYNLKTSDGQSFTGLAGNKLINFPSANTDYIIEISGSFPRWYQFGNSEAPKVLDIMQWGTIKWSSFWWAFYDCVNLISSATDRPDLSNVTIMGNMFGNTQFNSNISDWDISNVIHTFGMFSQTPFNQDISGWNTSNVTNMSAMFAHTPFNQDISGWDTSNVTQTEAMFQGSPFNQDISSWDVSKVTDMERMFANSQFNQDISSWNVSSANYMMGMFRDSSFNQNISGWNVSNVTSWTDFRTNGALTTPNTPPKFV